MMTHLRTRSSDYMLQANVWFKMVPRVFMFVFCCNGRICSAGCFKCLDVVQIMVSYLHCAVLSVSPRCEALRSCLMNIPYGPQCLDRIEQLMRENNISPPTLPQMPGSLAQLQQQITQQFPATQQVTQQLAQLQQGLPQEFSQQLSQVPQQITKLTQRVSSLPQQLPSLAQSNLPPQLTNLPQQLSNLPQRLSSLPQQASALSQRAQQYYSNVANRLNSLKPM